MRRDNPLKHFAIAFAIAIVIYVAFYAGIEHRRTRKGPWMVTFTNTAAGEPEVIVNQPFLAITNQVIRFPGESAGTNAPTTLRFAQPRQVPYAVPFGRCVFMDATFLPGTLTLQFFGHELEFLPRVLIIDHREHPWRTEPLILLSRTNRVAEATDTDINQSR
jgi:hypothetical protein